MKKIVSSLAFMAMAGLAFFTGCKPADEVTPTAGKPTVTVTFDKANYGVQKDFKVEAVVSTQGDSAYITIIADGASTGNDMGAIYMMYQKDSDKAVKFTQQPNGQIIPTAGFMGSKADGTTPTRFDFAGGDYTFNVKPAVKASLKLTIPIKLRSESSAKSDVFTIWITKDGEKGRFDNPARALAYGIATVTLNYSNEALMNYYSTTMGNSANDTVASCFATSSGSNYSRANANNATTGKTIDFIYNNYNNPDPLMVLNNSQWIFGSFYTSTAAVDTDANMGTKNFFGAVDQITNFTKVAKATSTSWDNAVGDASLATEVGKVITSTTTSNRVVFTSNPSGEVFAFVTASGKKGLVKVGSSRGGITTSSTDTDGEIDIEVKVQR